MIDELIEASKAGQYLYAAPAFRDGRLDADDASRARAAVEAQPDHTRYHLLMALQRDAPEAYAALPAATRAAVLAGALGHVQFLNDFGYLSPGGSHDGESAVALLDCGDAALEHLRPLLDDTSPAPSRGSEAATVAKVNQLRRCDYAYRYAARLRGADPGFHPDVEVRDMRIAELRERL